VVKAEDARGLGCENRRGEEVIEVCINVHPTHGTDRRLHVEPEPRSSFDAILRARGREVCRDELVSNKFHVCVGQKIGVPPKLREFLGTRSWKWCSLGRRARGGRGGRL
jgi:hypothetical protein